MGPDSFTGDLIVRPAFYVILRICQKTLEGVRTGVCLLRPCLTVYGDSQKSDESVVTIATASTRMTSSNRGESCL